MENNLNHNHRPIIYFAPLALWLIMTLFFYLMGGGTETSAKATDNFKSSSQENLNAPESGIDVEHTAGESEISKESKYDKMLSETPSADTSKTKNLGNDSYQSKNGNASNANNLNQQEAPPKQYKPVPTRNYVARGGDEQYQQRERPDNTMNKQLLDALWKKELEINRLKRLKKLEVLDEQTEEPQQPIEEKKANGNSFFSTSKVNKNISRVGYAGIVDEKEVTNGSIISIRLMSDMLLKNGNVLKSGTVISGIVGINGERATIKITALKLDNEIIGVDMYVVDAQDGLEGVNCPLSAETLAKQNAYRQSSSLVQSPVVTDSRLISQGISVGTNAARNYVNRKASVQKLIIRSNHQIYIYQR